MQQVIGTSLAAVAMATITLGRRAAGSQQGQRIWSGGWSSFAATAHGGGGLRLALSGLWQPQQVDSMWCPEEVKNPSKNIPRSIMTAICTVIVFYLLVNISYLTVLTPRELISSAAVSVTWADRMIPTWAWIMPVSVAVSIFGSLNGGMFRLGRLNYAGSKEGHLPGLISMLHVHYLTPAPAMIISTLTACVFVIPSDLIALTNYFGFASQLIIGLTCTSLIVLRHREPNLERPYKVFLPIAYIVVGISAFLVLAPIVQTPKVQYFYALLFMLSGILVYIPFVHFKLHIPYFEKVTCYLQLLLEVSPPDIYEDPKIE